MKKLLTVLLLLNISLLYAQDVVDVDSRMEKKLNEGWKKLTNKIHENYQSYLFLEHSPKRVCLKSDEYLYFIKPVLSTRRDKVEYEITRIKTNKDELKEENLKLIINTILDLNFNLMSEQKWTEDMEFDPPKKFDDVKIFSLKTVTTKSIDEIIEFIE